jgi:hypothetical protein
MSGRTPKPLDPGILMEASRVMNAAGTEFAAQAKFFSDLALQQKDATGIDPATRAGIIGDAAALLLRTPGNYNQALELLQETGTKTCPDPKGRLYILRALAGGQKFTAAAAADPAKIRQVLQLPPQKDKDDDVKLALESLLAGIRNDLAAAFKIDPELRKLNQGYWNPGFCSGSDGAQGDLQAVYEKDPDFRQLVKPHPEHTPR